MKYFEKIAILEDKSPEEVRRTFVNAERALIKNQREYLKKYVPISAGVGAAGGMLVAPKKHGFTGALVGGILGLSAGAVSAIVKGSRGSKSNDIRQKYFGTKDLNEIEKALKGNFKNLNDFYKEMGY